MNKYMAIGRLTKDPELRETTTGKQVVRFGLAVNNGNQDATFINCQAWGTQAETINKYLRKGSAIAIEAEVRTGSYEKDGKKVYTTDFIVQKFDFMPKGKDEEKPAGNDDFIPAKDDDADLPF